MEPEKKQHLTIRLLLMCGIIGPPLFYIVILIEGATRPGYSAWHHFGSLLSQSEYGWMQVINFLVFGVLMICFAIGLRLVLSSGRGSAWGPILFFTFGVGLLFAGAFTIDPMLGYPPGVPEQDTIQGNIHGLAGLTTFSSVSVACLVMARRFVGDPTWRGWVAYSVVSGILCISLGVIGNFIMVNLDQSGILPNAPLGLSQRIAILSWTIWIPLFAYRLLGQYRLANKQAQPGISI